VLLVFAGRLVGWKGLAVAIDAIAHPALAGLPLRLAIVGDGPERTKLEARARMRDAGERVVFHEAVAHAGVPAIYASADIAVFPIIGDEAFGISIAEAMSCGCAVLASHVGGIPEVVGNEGHAGRLVAAGQVDDWIAAIAALAQDAAARRALGAAARERIVANFTWAHAATRLLRALEHAA
jgi:glycosyltransferase involved in cell wall biosynthesis